VEGCLAEYVVMPSECCFPIPDELSMEEGALVEPLSIGIYSVHSAGCLKKRSVGILGCGPIGLCVLLLSVKEGARAYVTDKIDARLEIGSSAGPVWWGNPLRENINAAILEQEPDGLDVVFECCGQQDALDQAVELLKPGGKLMVIGIPASDRVSFKIDALRRKEISIHNVRRQNNCMTPAIQFAVANDVLFMVTHRFGFEDSQAAFDLVNGYHDGVMKAMIHF
jgi:L-iditol 2-dehydrogenase